MQLVQSFCDDHKTGNFHQVQRVDTFSSKHRGEAHSMALSPAIYVEIRLRKTERSAELRFYHRGHEVQNCGSGTLAAAHYLLAEKLVTKAEMLEYTLSSRLKDSRTIFSGSMLGLRQQRMPPPIRRAIKHGFWRRVLGSAPVKAYGVGKHHPYLLLEFRNAGQIEQLRPRMSKLANFCNQAVIVTAKARPQTKEDYVMRYFAPRFGNPEDIATGSANFILMQYWWKVFGKTWLRAAQLSHAGGSFKGRIVQNCIELYGETKYTYNVPNSGA